MRKYLDERSAIRIFKCMVLPYMEYSFFCMSPCPDKEITKLQRLQNRGLRVCLKPPPRTPVLCLHASSKLLLVKNKIQLNILQQMHRFIYRPNCPYKKNLNLIDCYTRSLLVPSFVNIYPCSTRFQKSLCGQGFCLWNKLPAEMRKTANIEEFTCKVKYKLCLEQNHALDDNMRLPQYMRRT